MNDTPTNEPLNEVEPAAEALADTAVSSPPPLPAEEPRPSRRWLLAGGAVIVLLVVVIAAASAWVANAQNSEETHWQQAQAAAREGVWTLAEQSLDAQLALQPAFALRHTAEAQGLRGIARYEQGNLEGALADLNAALAQDANLLDLYAYRALLLAPTDPEAARADAQTAVASNLLSGYWQAQMQALLVDRSDPEALAALLAAPEYLTDAQVAELTLAQVAAADEPAAIVAAATAVLAREFALQPAQTARLAFAAASAYQALGDADAAFLQADAALAQPDGLSDAERAALHLLRAEWYQAYGDLATAVAEAQAAAALDESVTLHLALQGWLAYREFALDTAVESATAVLETAPADSLPAQIAHRTLGGVATLQDTPRPALAALDAALAIDPDDVEARALRVVNLLRVSEWTKAEDDVAWLADTAPTAPPSLWAQGLLATVNGDFELAHVLLDQAIAQDSTRPEYFSLRATSYRGDSERPQALADVEAALALYPDYLPALESQQFLHLDQYHYQQLEEAARQMIAMYPDSPTGYHLLAVHYVDVAGDEAEALNQVEEAITRNPEHETGYLLRGRIHYEMREFEAARADYEEALALNPDSAQARKGLADLAWQADDLETAVSLIQETIALYPRSLGAKASLVSAYMDQEEVDKAWELVHQILAEDPRNEQALGLRAYLYANQGDFENAIRDTDYMLRLNPDNPYAHLARASFLLELGRLDEVAAAARKASELNPLLADPHRLLFAVAFETDDVDEGKRQLDLWQEKASVFDDDPGLLSFMQLVTGRAEEAVATATAALAENPDADTYYFNRALAYLDLGQSEAGQADLEEVLAISDNITLIADAEVALAESKKVVSIADGRLQYTNDSFGYTLNYADWWVKQSPSEPQMDLLLIFETEDDFGAAYTVLFTEQSEISAAVVGEIVTNDIVDRPGFTLVSADPAPFNDGNSYVIRYELLGSELFQGKQYIFAQGSRVILLTVEAFDRSFAELEAELDAMAASFSFLP